MDLYEKSLETLEFPAVLDQLASNAVSEAAKQRALALRPFMQPYEVLRCMKETSAAKTMCAVKASPSFLGVKEVSAALYRADMGGMLSTRELLDIAGVLHAARMVKAYADGEMKTDIDYMFSALQPNKYLEEKISNSIIGEDEIADSASSELSSLRRQMRLTSAGIREALQKIISSQTYSKALQEAIITMRSDRYVVPVKAEYKNVIPGLVHDISSSGATLFIEPMQSVKANNELRELQAREKKEIERILMELSAEAAGFKEDIVRDFELLVSLDLVFAKAKLSYKQNASEPELHVGNEIVLRHARHPLLPPKQVVPIDIQLGGQFDTLMVTGPNTGGKTVSIKTLGLLCAMARAGLHIPTDDGSKVPLSGGILADIGDEQSIEQSLSTFSSHMTNIKGMLEHVEPGTLVLFDELGAGTDPAEGAALAIAIIEYVRKHGALVAATTHYAELKVYATSTEGVQNASCEFDVSTLKPTYRLLIGIPGKSNAFAISERLGIPKKIIEDAKSRLDVGTTDFEDVISRLEAQRISMEENENEVRRLRREAEENAKQSEEHKNAIEKEREKAALVAKREAERIIRNARSEAEQIFRELSELQKKAAKEQNWQQINEAKTEINRKLNESESAMRVKEEQTLPPPSSRPLKVGDRVTILSMGTQADVLAINADRVITLQAGIMKITAQEDDVRLIEGGAAQANIKKLIKRSEAQLRTLSQKPEVDLRGMTVMEAMSVLDRFIDGAVLAKLETVTIIHGKGTGAVRAAVHDNLRKNPQISSFRLGRYGEGENGVTIAKLK